MSPLPGRYRFGIYHWRRRAASIAVALVAAGGAVLLCRRSEHRGRRLAAAAIGLAALARVASVARRALSPPPWALERAKYDALARRLPLDDADRVLDVGCGTGRSLVGFAPHVSPGTEVLGLDVFDDRIILGNGPALARRNGARAGLEVTPVAGDAAALPVAAGSIDVVTACRVLHDLEARVADDALRELHRACAPDGVVGILELPLLPDGVPTDRDPEAYWSDRVSAAGLRIDLLERVDRPGSDEPYVLIVAAPASGARDR
ncbi:class I SAM-dependent methyltransferase [Natrialbaceae archaeon GCM10025810]|uniref:class I SAM-dependent methyltransferase n=1 Tax=Halovalidus salilacus TaxID=3075124 RepID=UPI003618A8C4